jgi:endonuclease/exonuclease/phosphatase family metal-dependent hydrolase
MKQVLAAQDFKFVTSAGHSVLVSILATHLKAKTGFDEQRRLQCLAIANEIDSKKNPEGLTIICGDFNTESDSKAIKTLLSKTKSMSLKSTYSTVSHGGVSCDPDWTTWKIRERVKKTTIDFMFHDANSTWQPVDVWKIPYESQIDLDVALPCAGYPSDHVALATKFELVE